MLVEEQDWDEFDSALSMNGTEEESFVKTVERYFQFEIEKDEQAK